ncbi:hypothetical protein YSA_03090 [Pseudomonas putida ND6]|uniref:Uncharacterized protein n=1 Tax=Pseudomonas putida ND6 TaxID=231023 RepID=I3USH3_PSEPU|nr:hypothetical protein YSA_03090 [Pseudomonas putida ND6]
MANAHFAERRQNKSGTQKVMRSKLALNSHSLKNVP